jgi:Sigma-70, region 4
MSSIDELPPDQRAALSLVLRQRKDYEELAQLLNISPQAVHDRAHVALAVLAPAQARALDAAQREEIGEYLLGQQSDAGARLRTRTLLSSSPAAAAWAQALAAQLDGLAPGALPEIPAGGPAVTPAADAPVADGPARQHPRPSSRVGGALLLAAIVAVVVVVVVFVSKGGSSSHKNSGTSTTASGTHAKVEGRIILHPQNPASHATGTVQILSEGSKRAFFIQAEHLPQTTGHTFYAIWLYSSPTSALALSKAPAVGPSHKLAGAALLPSNAASYREILLTRETSTRPSRPGPIVLRGALNLSG